MPRAPLGELVRKEGEGRRDKKEGEGNRGKGGGGNPTDQLCPQPLNHGDATGDDGSKSDQLEDRLHRLGERDDMRSAFTT